MDHADGYVENFYIALHWANLLKTKGIFRWLDYCLWRSLLIFKREPFNANQSHPQNLSGRQQPRCRSVPDCPTSSGRGGGGHDITERLISQVQIQHVPGLRWEIRQRAEELSVHEQVNLLERMAGIGGGKTHTQLGRAAEGGIR